MTKKVTLHYFNLKGLGEPVRYALAYAKVDFNDHRVEMEEWPQLKPQMPAGKLPVLEIDGKQLTQSAAILVYLANEHGMTGKGSWEIAKLQEVDGTIGDIQTAFSKMMYETDADKKKQIAEELRTKTMPEMLGALTRIAQLDQGNKFILGDKPAWADFKLAALTERVDDNFADGNMRQLNALLADHRDRVQALPGVKEYIAKRPQTIKERDMADRVAQSKK